MYIMYELESFNGGAPVSTDTRKLVLQVRLRLSFEQTKNNN